MLKIATHDSVTGEKSHGLLSYLGLLFAKTQSKTINEQYKAGCRLFDIRIRDSKRGLICAHGLWQCKRLANDILNEINEYGDCYVQLTYEGSYDEIEFSKIADAIVNIYSNIKFTTINIKYPKWKCIGTYNNIPINGAFLHLDFNSWHTYIPIPILWKKIYYNKPSFNNDMFTMVDFL